MAKRPALTEDSFLRHIFSPKKNPLPTGIRSRPLVSAKGRKSGRVAAYNRMSATNQELLRRSGQREAYLKGTASLADARKTLRETAVGKGIAKPLRAAQRKIVVTPDAVADHVVTELGPGNIGNEYKLRYRVGFISDPEQRRILAMKAAEIKRYASSRDNNVIVEGVSVNPLWYHHS